MKLFHLYACEEPDYYAVPYRIIENDQIKYYFYGYNKTWEKDILSITNFEKYWPDRWIAKKNPEKEVRLLIGEIF